MSFARFAFYPHHPPWLNFTFSRHDGVGKGFEIPACGGLSHCG
jgi:hypothetical protein